MHDSIQSSFDKVLENLKNSFEELKENSLMTWLPATWGR